MLHDSGGTGGHPHTSLVDDEEDGGGVVGCWIKCRREISKERNGKERQGKERNK